jgi:hypothetical protein
MDAGFVGCDLQSGLVVLVVVAVMLLLGDSYFLTSTVAKWIGVRTLTFAEVYGPLLKRSSGSGSGDESTSNAHDGEARKKSVELH